MSKVRHYAIQTHRDQLYDGGEYVANHIDPMIDLLARHGYTSQFWIDFAHLHDVLEDGYRWLSPTQRRDALWIEFGDVADYVYEVSGFGRNRKERNLDMASRMKSFEAKTLKLVDRIINYRGKPDMYSKEMNSFIAMVDGGDQRFIDMLVDMDREYRNG